jgi:serine/threonine-protein kinase
MGAVYRAHQTSLHKKVAIKVLHRQLADQPTFVERFEREAISASLLDHPNSLRMLDFGKSDGLLYLVMEFAEGEDLMTVMHREWPFDDRRIVDIMSQALTALATAHDLGIVHRDLKPENIFLTGRNGTRDFVKVLNFGVAALTTAALEEGETGSGQLCSAPAYVAPEVALAQPADHRADIYSLGCLLYEMLTGTPPFEGRSVVDVINKHIQDPPLPMRARRPDLDIAADIDTVVMRALQKDPDRRFASVADFAVAVEQCRSASRRLIAFAAEGVVGRDDDRGQRGDAGRTSARKLPATRLAKATVIAALSCAAAIATYAALHGF